jgi:hypothetical protein
LWPWRPGLDSQWRQPFAFFERRDLESFILGLIDGGLVVPPTPLSSGKYTSRGIRTPSPDVQGYETLAGRKLAIVVSREVNQNYCGMLHTLGKLRGVIAFY